MRKVFLDNLPHTWRGVDWINSIGYKIKFVYDDVSGEFEISNYNKTRLKIKYQTKIFYVLTSCLTGCKISKILGLYDNGYKYQVGEIVNNLKIIEQTKIPHQNKSPDKAYKYQCINDNHIGVIRESNLKIGRGCPICSHSFKMPEKIMYYLLQQLKIVFDYQYTPDWIKPRRYDFYIPSKQIIIEMDGGYGHGHRNTKHLTKEESKSIDQYKDKIADEHNIHVIRINCDYGNARENSFTYIKNNILHSEFSKFYNLSIIDWNKINNNVHKSIVKKVCSYYSKYPNNSCKQIADAFNFDHTTIIKYLKIGTKNKWCYYNADKKRNQGLEYGRKLKNRNVICTTTNTVYNSAKSAGKSMNVCPQNIYHCCRKHTKSAGHFMNGIKLHWMYLDEYMKQNGYTDISQLPNAIIHNESIIQ